MFILRVIIAFITHIVAIIVPNFATNTTCKYANCLGSWNFCISGYGYFGKKPSNQFQSLSLDLLKIHSTNQLYFRCILFLNRNLCLPYRCASIKSSSNLMELYPVSACQFRAAESLLWQLRSSTRLLIGSFQNYSHLIGQSP